MKIFNVNLGIGLASSGVEYAQAYRHRVFEEIGLDQKYIFLDMMSKSSVYDLAENIGIKEKNVLWFYDILRGGRVKTSKINKNLLGRFIGIGSEVEEDDSKLTITRSPGNYTVLYKDIFSKSEVVYDRVEHVVNYCLVRKDFYSEAHIYCSEYYTPKDGKAYLYKRVFFNNFCMPVIEEFVHTLDDSSFRYKGKFYFSKEELLGVFLELIGIEEGDWFIIDRTTGTAKTLFSRKEDFGYKIAVVVHAEHYVKEGTSKKNILWNNYYDYPFRNSHYVDVFISSTDGQTQKLKEHLGLFANCRTVPVGFIEDTRENVSTSRKKLVTVSRLSSEKNLDVLIRIMGELKDSGATLDIYGEGGERTKLESLIKELGLGDVVSLKGHHNMSDIYKNYSTYVSTSQAEGFGLSLLEAVGSGLFIVGYHVDYGNTTFISLGKTGYFVNPPKSFDNVTDSEIKEFAETLRRSFDEENLDRSSVYSTAERYLLDSVKERWSEVLDV